MNHHEASRKSWATKSLFSASVEEINSGSLQRIADATEKMASSYDAVRNDRDYYKRAYEERRNYAAHLERRIASLKGAITRAKKARP